MAVRVRLFASLREAAGTDEVVATPGPLPALLADLRGRFGEPFTTRLAGSSVLVDGTGVARDSELDVGDGAEVALLPPVSGGSSATDPMSSRERSAQSPLASVLLPVAVGAVTVGALAVGERAFLGAVLLVAVATLLDLSVLLTPDVARPVLLTALIPPVAVAAVGFGGAASGALDRLPSALGLTLLLTLVLLLASPRRRDAASVAAATATAALVIGAGCAGLIALYGGALGGAVVFAVLLLGTLPPLAAAVVAILQPAAPGWAIRVGATLVVAGALLATFVPPLPIPVLALVAAVAALGTEGAAGTAGLLAGDRVRGGVLGPVGDGRVVAAAGGVLLAAPVLYFLVRATAV